MSVEDINRFTKDDIVCALEMFNEDYVTFPRDAIAVDVLQISQYSTLTRICCIIGMVSVMGAGWDSFQAFKQIKKYLSSQGNR